MSASGTTTANLNLRAGPSTADAVQQTLASGTAIEILENRGDWLRVRVASTGREGFVSAKFVRLPGVEVVTGYLKDDAAVGAAVLAPPQKKQAAAGSGDAGATAARIWNAYGGLLATVAARLAIEPETGVAVLAVESGGTAFVQGRMVIRFENHIFFDRWGKANPAAFAEHFRYSAEARWKGHEFRASAAEAWKSFHGKQAGEWEVFEFAQRLDRQAARMSISMGLPQVMGFNFAALGFKSVDEMFGAFSDAGSGERAQVVGMFDFIRGAKGTSPMLEALRGHDWTGFAKRYNGTGQAEVYGTRLKAAYAAAKGLLPA
jgi:hypothetical protein